jgi:CheY-like chemotaxis protein
MSSTSSFPFAVRLIGFAPEEAAAIDKKFAEKRSKGYRYFCLPEDNLQDPDLFLANANEWKALVALSYLGPSAVRPVLLVGTPEIELPHARVPSPIKWTQLFEALDALIEKRADTLSRLEASDVVTVPERRRRDRLDVDLTDPGEYVRMRRPPVIGGVLIIDKNASLSDYVANLLARRKVPVSWSDDETAVLDFCRKSKISLVMVNTSTPNVDPYRLCEAIKTNIAERATVIFLVGKSFAYNQALARQAGCDGFLNKPVTSNCLISVFKKFLPQAR